MPKIKLAILAIASDCPQINYWMLDGVCKSYDAARNYVAKLVKGGYLQKIEHRNSGDGSARYSITKKGLLEVYTLQRRFERKGIDLSEKPSDVFFTKDLTIPMNNGAFVEGGNSHFKAMELTYLWMQLKFLGGRKRALLWDFVDEPKRYGLSGNPDIVLHDGFDFNNMAFRRSIFVELETTKKSDEKVKEKIEALVRNEFHFLIFVGSDMGILRKISIGMRHFLTSSKFYASKGSYGRTMYDKKAHLARIWFLHWNAPMHSMKNNDLGDQLVRRADHPDFDHYEFTKNSMGDLIRTKLISDRWEGGNESTVNRLLNYLSSADKANGME